MSLALAARDVVVELGGRRVLDGVSFEVGRGEFAALCGPNGGGKTTLLRAALGLVTLASGSIEVLGGRPGAATAAVGYLPQTKSFSGSFPARVVDVIAAAARGAWPFRVSGPERAHAQEVLARVGGEQLLDSPLRGLSGGELQRVFLARALARDPALLLLDEPTAGVDGRGRAEFLELLAGIAERTDLAAVLVTHNAAAVRRLADRAVYLDGTLRAWGSPEEVLAREWERRLRLQRPRPRGARGRPLRGRLMDELLELLVSPLGQGFVRRALMAGLALGTAGALLGVFVVQRGLGLVADGLAHATFGGIALGLLLGATPDRAIWVALPFTVAVALGIQQLRRRTSLGGDVATGVFFAVSFAAGVMFLGLRGPRGVPVNVEALLFGSLLAVSPEALFVVGFVSLLVVAVLVRVGPQLAYATFDAELARLSGVHVQALESLLLALTALVVVVGVKTVGVVLIAAFVVIPAAAAQLLGRTLGATLVLAVAASLAGTAFGLFASYHLNVAPGATIVLTLGAFFFLALVLRRR